MAEDSQRTARRRTRDSRRSLNLSEKQIEQASAVGPEDADAAEVSWRKYAPAGAKNLLAAEEDDDERTEP